MSIQKGEASARIIDPGRKEDADRDDLADNERSRRGQRQLAGEGTGGHGLRRSCAPRAAGRGARPIRRRRPRSSPAARTTTTADSRAGGIVAVADQDVCISGVVLHGDAENVRHVEQVEHFERRFDSEAAGD